MTNNPNKIVFNTGSNTHTGVSHPDATSQNHEWNPFDDSKQTAPTQLDKLDTKDSTKMYNKIAKDISIRNKDPEEVAENQKLIIQLVRYGNHDRFKAYLQSLNFNLNASALKKLSNAELEETQTRVKLALQNKTQSSLMTGGVLLGTRATEAIVTAKSGGRIDLTGWSQSLRTNEEFLDVIAELELSYGSITSMTPEKRLIFILGTSAMQVSQTNNGMKKLQEGLKARSTPVESETAVAEECNDSVEEETNTTTELCPSDPEPVAVQPTPQSTDNVLSFE